MRVSPSLITFALWSLIASILQRLSCYIYILLLALPFCSSPTKPFWRHIIFCCCSVVPSLLLLFFLYFFLSISGFFRRSSFFCSRFLLLLCFYRHDHLLLPFEDTYTIHIHGTRCCRCFMLPNRSSVLYSATAKWLTLLPTLHKRAKSNDIDLFRKILHFL